MEFTKKYGQNDSLSILCSKKQFGEFWKESEKMFCDVGYKKLDM